MDNILDLENSEGMQDIPLSDLMADNPDVQVYPVPDSALRNRAAVTTFLASTPDEAISNYQIMRQEGQAGQDTTYKQLRETVLANGQKADIQGIMMVLSDPKIPMAQKEEAVRAMNSSVVLKDSGTNLFTNALQKASKGENREQETSRLSASDAIREIYDARQQQQGLVNAHAASLDSTDNGRNLAEMIELYVAPLGNSVNVGKINKALKQELGESSLWGTVKGFLLAGTTTADIRKRLENLPPEKRVEFQKAVQRVISENSGIIFSNDNQFAQYDKLQSITEEGGYGTVQEILDNLSPLLDLVGIGQAVRGGRKVAKAGGAAARVDELDPRGIPKFNASAGPEATIRREEVNSTANTAPPGTSVAVDTGPIYKVNQPGTDLVDNAPSAYRSDRLLGEVTPKLQAPLATRLKRLQPEQDITDVLERIETNAIKGRENPASPAAIIQQANPEQARSLHQAVVKSETDEVAEGLYGSSKTDAIATDIMPQAGTASGAVKSKVVDIERDLRAEMRVADELVDATVQDGAIYFTPAERAAARAHVVNDFQNAEGLVINNAMSSFKGDGAAVEVRAVYGTTEGGFLDAEQAVAQAKFALRSRGVKDEDITLLRKVGLDHVRVDLDEVRGVEGQYMVEVKTTSSFDVTDLSRLEEFDVKRNFFDRVPQFVSDDKGSVARYLMDSASMLHPIYTGAASVASDATSAFEKMMLQLASRYSDQYKKFSKADKAKVDDYIKEANYNGVKFDIGDLTARGMTRPQMDALKSWRDYWDAHFYLENNDVVRSLNSQGYQYFKNNHAELYAKPVAKNQNISRLYDPATDTVVTHVKADGDALYNAGGTYAKLRRPADFGGVTAEYMIVRNTPTEYLRKFRSSDQVLNYRDGYFQLQYKAPRFIDETVRTPSGAVDRVRTVAVAGDTVEAEAFAARMRTTTGNEYTVRGDDRAIRRDSDSWWDLNSASGRIAQRRRGKLLEDSSGLNHLGDGSYIVNPVDSAIRAARSISGRTVSRPMLDASKARFMNQYKDVLPSNGMGGVQFPSSVNEIGAKGEFFSSRVADARTTYSYLRYLENGYINSMDDAWKQLFNGMADMLGSKGYGKLERGALAASETAPTSLAKNGVFMSYIGINPFRQWIIQTHQIVRTFAYNPTGWATGNVQKLMAEYLGSIMVGGKNSSSDFGKFVRESGLLDSVDKSNLVRGTLTDAADLSNTALRTVGKATGVVRKVGFDIGEQGNLLGHAAAVFDRYKRIGKDLTDKSVREEAFSEIRAISYDMNFAGDMVYNQTSPAMLLQFMQVPHKAFLQMTNRRIPLSVRTKMVAADLLMWGPPTILVSDMLGVDILPDNPQAKEAVMYGFESAMLNWSFNELFDTEGEKTNVDFSSLAPYDMSGWVKFFHGFYDGGFHEVLMNSPAGQLFLKDGGRTQQALAAMGRYFSGFDEAQQKPETFLSMANEVAKISSGWNNAIKARSMLNLQKKLDQYGNIVDDKTTTTEAWAQLFGFGTSDMRDLYEIGKKTSATEKQFKEDHVKIYKDIRRYYAEQLEVPSNDPAFITAVTGAALKAVDDPRGMEIIRQEWQRDMVSKEDQLIQQMMRASRIPDPNSFRDSVKRAPISEESKELILLRFDHIQSGIKKD